jgi:hypothetical protein
MLVAALTAAAVLAPSATPPAILAPHRYVVVARDGGGTLRPGWQAPVRLAVPRAPDPVMAAAAAGSRDQGAVSATVYNAGGRVVAARSLHPPQWLRGEFAAANLGDGTIAGVVLPLETAHFVVRVPAAAGDRLELEAPDRQRVAVPAELVSEIEGADALLAAADVVPIRVAGSPANRLDIAIAAEGYTGVQREAFLADAHALADSFLATGPYAEYAALINVAALFVPSPAEGADHPEYRSGCAAGDPTCCADSAAQADPRAGTLADTAFDAAFCTAGIHRLLTVNTAKVLAAAAAVPDWDLLLVLVNDPVYGGSGGDVAVISREERAPEIARHELGHSFALLADEYATPFPGFPGCSDLVGPGSCEANVTDVIERVALKWAPWVLPDTPLPTAATDPSFAAVVGLFEGARYLATGMYRPRRECLMRQLARPFCEVCREAFVSRLYRGGWGIPAAGIDLVDPGSEIPPPGPVTVPAGEPLELSVALLAPETDPALAVAWSVDGKPLAGANGPTLSWVPAHPGVYRVELEVRDATGFVHPSHAADLVSRRAWEVSVPAPRPPRRIFGRKR